MSRFQTALVRREKFCLVLKWRIRLECDRKLLQTKRIGTKVLVFDKFAPKLNIKIFTC